MNHLQRAVAGIFCLALAITSIGCDSAQVHDSHDQIAAPLAGADAAHGMVAGEYIVIFTDDVVNPRELAGSLGRSQGADVLYTYEHALKGFAFRGSPAAAQALERNPHVARVDPNGIVTIADGGTQTNATWGLDRVDQRNRPLDGSYSYNTTAPSVHVYILDTGIRYAHSDFGGRVSSTFFDAFGGNGNDGNGHGTHVAGTVGGTQWGIAKGVTLFSVRVLNNQGSGTFAGVMAGIDWVTGRKLANPSQPMVANMSLGGGGYTELDNAVRNSVAAGVTYAVAAGNNNGNACSYSPARVAEALTVGATTTTDSRASFSNFGSCVDIFAPGVNITSAWHTNNTATNTISGTSMAAPHVAGAAALHLQTNPSATPAQVAQAVHQTSTKNIVANSNSANNHLLYTLDFGGGGDPPPPPPVGPDAAFTYSCTDLVCSFTDTSAPGDNSIVSRAWTFGDGNGSSAQSPSHTYSAGGTYTVTLTVTDSAGLSDSSSQTVSVSGSEPPPPPPPPPPSITLSTDGYKVRGRIHFDLSWSGAGGSQVDVYQDGSLLATVANSGGYTISTNLTGNGNFEHQVCEAGTSTCSNITSTRP